MKVRRSIMVTRRGWLRRDVREDTACDWEGGRLSWDEPAWDGAFLRAGVVDTVVMSFKRNVKMQDAGWR